MAMCGWQRPRFRANRVTFVGEKEVARKKLSRKERKQQEEARKARIRRQTGWTEPQPTNEPQLSEEDSLLDPELRELVASFAEGDPEVISGNIFEALSTSMLWVNEPEFEDLIFDPVQTTDVFIEAATEQGWAPESIHQPGEEELEDLYFEIVPALIPQLLTPEIRQQLLHGLEQIGHRFKKEGETEQALQAGFLRMFLKGQSEPQLWGMVGLLHAIFRRTLATGFSLAEVFTELNTVRTAAGNDLASMIDAVEKGNVGQRVRGLLEGIPGLRRFMEKEVDEVWENGLAAAFSGDLYLGIYTEEELERGMQMIEESIASAIAAGTSPDVVVQEKGQEIVVKVDGYVTGLFATERLDQLRSHLNNIVREKQVDQEWFTIVTLLRGYLNEDDAAENVQPFLVRALFGEVRRAAEATAQEEEE